LVATGAEAEATFNQMTKYSDRAGSPDNVQRFDERYVVESERSWVEAGAVEPSWEATEYKILSCTQVSDAAAVFKSTRCHRYTNTVVNWQDPR
jgi:hypothetical protein